MKTSENPKRKNVKESNSPENNWCFVESESESIRRLLAKYSGNGSDDDLDNLDNSLAMGPATI